MELSRGFRESYEYNNHMFIVLGHVMERIYGRPWRELVLERIARPLGIEMRFRGRDCDFSGLDCALPHRPDGKGGAYRCAYADNVVAGPCGGIRTNLLGMIAWLRCLLDSGAPLCAAQAFQDLLVPNVPTESEGGHELLCSYAMGWRTSAYRGKRLVYHGGAIARVPVTCSLFSGGKQRHCGAAEYELDHRSGDFARPVAGRAVRCCAGTCCA